MVAQLFLHPFRLTVAGQVATAAQGSDTYLDSQVRVICGSKLGERDMVPTYGIPDPAYGRLTASDIQTCADRFGPDDLSITSVESVPTDDLNVKATVTWARRGNTP